VGGGAPFDRYLLAREWEAKCSQAPAIELARDWDYRRPGTMGTWVSSAPQQAHHFYFWLPAVTLMPAPVLAVLIAHELAHPAHRILDRSRNPYRYERGSLALRLECWPDVYEGGNVDMSDEEKSVVAIQERWGFPYGLFRRWAQRHRLQLTALDEKQRFHGRTARARVPSCLTIV
jgi:hypothetical protein